MAGSLARLMVLASPLSALGADPARIAPVPDRILAKKGDRIEVAACMPPLNMTMRDRQIAGLEIEFAPGNFRAP